MEMKEKVRRSRSKSLQSLFTSLVLSDAAWQLTTPSLEANTLALASSKSPAPFSLRIYLFGNTLTLSSFAWAEMRMVAANFLSRFDIDEVPGQDVDFRQFITMQFATGNWKTIIKQRFEDN